MKKCCLFASALLMIGALAFNSCSNVSGTDSTNENGSASITQKVDFSAVPGKYEFYVDVSENNSSSILDPEKILQSEFYRSF